MVSSYAVIIGFTLLGLVAAFSIHPDKVNVRPKVGSGTHIAYLGSADGKDFFADATVWRNWTDSKAYCEFNGLQLAEISTPAQLQVLQDAFDVYDFYGHYWTAGRDALTLRQFTWDNSNTQPSEDFLGIKDIFVAKYQTCLEFHSFGPATQSHLDIDYCHYEQGTLCEKVPRV